MVLMSALAFIVIAACSAPATPTPGAPAATPDIGATVEARVRVELGSAAATRAAWPTALPSPAPAAAATPDISATVQAAIAAAMPTATPALAPVPAATATPMPTPVPTPAPTATPTWMEWLHQGLGRTRCADPGHEIRYDNLNTTPPYSADIYCVAPAPAATPTPTVTPTPLPTATPMPTPRPTRRPTATPHPTPTPLPTATPRPARIPQDRGSRLAGITVLIISSDSLGTGFFAVTEAEGRYYVFTNDHVVGDDGAVDVYWHLARETLTARVLKSSANLDIAVLEIQPSDFRDYPVGWGGFSYGRDNYDKGDEVWIAGYPSDMGSPFGKARWLGMARFIRKDWRVTEVGHAWNTA